MGFLLKTAFWLSLVIVLLPAPENDGTQPQLVSTTEAVSLLSAALNDFRGFCGRNPEACVTGAAAAQTFGHKAQHATRLLHDFISEKLEENNSVNAPSLGQRTAQSPRRQTQLQGGNTLTPSDLEPIWRAPETKQASLKRA